MILSDRFYRTSSGLVDLTAVVAIKGIGQYDVLDQCELVTLCGETICVYLCPPDDCGDTDEWKRAEKARLADRWMRVLVANV